VDRYDVWMAHLGPREVLLREFLGGGLPWGQFARRYRAELFDGGDVDRRNRTIKNHGQKFTLRLLRELGERSTVTLMCHCADEEAHCHRHLLAAAVKRA